MPTEITAALIAAVVGVVSGFVGAVLKAALDRRTKLDEDLLKERRTLYAELWQETKVLPKWPRASDVTYQDVAEFSAQLRDWYFLKGGMYLSSKARQSYGGVQDRIWSVLGTRGKDRDMPLLAEDYDAFQAACSAMRTELTRDLLSRRGAARWV
jgi:hypothetical protein